MTRKWIGWSVAAVLAVAIGAASHFRGETPMEVAPAATDADLAPAATDAGLAEALLDVQGMACSSCSATVKAMLERTPGVFHASVSVEEAESVVAFDSKRITPAQIVQVVERLGYKVRLKEPTRP